MHWSTARTVPGPVSCQPFFYYYFFVSLVIDSIAPRAIPSSTATHTILLSTLLSRDDNGPETCSSPFFSLHLPPSASIGSPRRTRPANSHPRPALVIKASFSYTPSLSATTSEYQ